MKIEFNPFTGNFDYVSDFFEVVNHGADTILTLDDMKKIHHMDTSVNPYDFTLPDVGLADVGQWVVLSRTGPNPLRINAAGMDIIFNSSPGGYIECVDVAHDFSSLFLVVVADGLWGTPSFGIWDSY